MTDERKVAKQVASGILCGTCCIPNTKKNLTNIANKYYSTSIQSALWWSTFKDGNKGKLLKQVMKPTESTGATAAQKASKSSTLLQSLSMS